MKPVDVDGSVVAKLRALLPREAPDHLLEQGSRRTSRDYDPNTCFDVLQHISMKDGYVLDYVYCYTQGFGGHPCLYAKRQYKEPDLDTYQEYEEWRKASMRSLMRSLLTPENANWIEDCIEVLATDGILPAFLDVDDTPDSFFQLSVFNRMAHQFYLSWHANYDDVSILTSKKEVGAMVRSITSGKFGQRFTDDQISAILSIPPQPSVVLNETTASVIYCCFTKWGGFERLNETIRRDPPHLIINRKALDSVEYDCGVDF